MSQVIADPRELRAFASQLRQFNGELSGSSTRVRGQLRALSQTWRDQEYAKFSGELEEAIQGFQRYLQGADMYIQHLNAKAAALEEFLRRR